LIGEGLSVDGTAAFVEDAEVLVGGFQVSETFAAPLMAKVGGV
jgi:hypothetical protein